MPSLMASAFLVRAVIWASSWPRVSTSWVMVVVVFISLSFCGAALQVLLGQWLYIEGKYATPLRGLRPFEREHVFMISPVLRLNF